MGSSDSKRGKKNYNAIDQTLNGCQIVKFSSQFLMKMILEKLKKYSNITFRCPMKAVSSFCIQFKFSKLTLLTFLGSLLN